MDLSHGWWLLTPRLFAPGESQITFLRLDQFMFWPGDNPVRLNVLVEQFIILGG